WAMALVAGVSLLMAETASIPGQTAPGKKAVKKLTRVQTEEEVFRLLLKLAPVPLQHQQPVSSLTFSADGKTVTTVSNAEGRLVHWDAATGKLLRQVRLPLGSLERSAVSKDSRLLLAVDLASKVSLWDSVTGKKVSVLAKASGFGVALSADGKS